MLGVIMMILLIALTSVVFITELTFTVGEEQEKLTKKLHRLSIKTMFCVICIIGKVS